MSKKDYSRDPIRITHVIPPGITHVIPPGITHVIPPGITRFARFPGGENLQNRKNPFPLRANAFLFACPLMKASFQRFQANKNPHAFA